MAPAAQMSYTHHTLYNEYISLVLDYTHCYIVALQYRLTDYLFLKCYYNSLTYIDSQIECNEKYLILTIDGSVAEILRILNSSSVVRAPVMTSQSLANHRETCFSSRK